MQTSEARRGELLTVVAGYCGLIGCAAAIVSDIAAIIAYPPHNPIADTISALAEGPYGWIQDWGLYFFAAAIFACAVGLDLNFGSKRVLIARLLLGVMSLVIVAIAGVNQDMRVTVPASNLHLGCVLALYAILVINSGLLVSQIARLNRICGWLIGGIGVVWTVLAPIFFIVPTEWDGAYERFLAVLAIGWVSTISIVLIGYGKAGATMVPDSA
ncbi:DUF998 domain-containing protein [Devosia pacifica]|uniref:DUF998 domain-containing protein n=1 Tax=Devosia pacifica TaxID=1335967 RepID=UPI0016726F19|nr:DUF998 domain-containing protein [Devosia pacifica]